AHGWVRQRRITSVNWTTSTRNVSRRRLWYATQSGPPQLQHRSRFGSSRRSVVGRGRGRPARRAIYDLPPRGPRIGRPMLRSWVRFRQVRFAVLAFLEEKGKAPSPGNRGWDKESPLSRSAGEGVGGGGL